MGRKGHWEYIGNKENKYGGKNNKPPKRVWVEDKEPTYQPSKLFNVLAGGVMLFVAGALGFTLITNIFTGIRDAVDTADTVQNIAKNVTNNTKANTGKHYGYKSINYEVDINEQDVANVLSDIHSALLEQGAEDDMNAIVIQYDTFLNSELYNERVTSTLTNYNNPITFIAINYGNMTDEEMKNEFDTITKMINSQVLPAGTKFTTISKNSRLNTPNAGNFTIAVTYYW